MLTTATAIESLVKADPTATGDERKAILNALRGNKNTRPKLISKRQAAEICDSSTKSIDRYSERGYLTPIRFSKRKIRFDEDEILDFARNGISMEVL